jgi:hypothetical protein
MMCGAHPTGFQAYRNEASMRSTALNAYITHYKNGILSANEVIHQVLVDLLFNSKCNAQALMEFQVLPSEVKREFLVYMDRIKGDDFLWRPFFIGPDPRRHDLTEFSDRLRLIYAALSEMPPMFFDEAPSTDS